MKIYLVSKLAGIDGWHGPFFEPVKAFYDKKVAEAFVASNDKLLITELDIEGTPPVQDSLASAINSMFR